MDGGGTLLASSFGLFLSDSACLGSSSSVLFLLPLEFAFEDAAEVEACRELRFDVDGGGILLASSFSLLLRDSACLGSSSSVLFLLPLEFASEDAAEVEACPELRFDVDGGGILRASSSFGLLLSDSACLGSSSSVLFLLPWEFAFARIGEGETVLGSWAEFKPKGQSIIYNRVIEPLTYNLLQGGEHFDELAPHLLISRVGPSDTALGMGRRDKTVRQCEGCPWFV